MLATSPFICHHASQLQKKLRDIADIKIFADICKKIEMRHKQGLTQIVSGFQISNH